MSRRPARFTQADVARARRAAPDCVVEIMPDGVIRIIPVEQGLTLPGSEASLDRELQEHLRTHGHG